MNTAETQFFASKLFFILIEFLTNKKGGVLRFNEKIGTKRSCQKNHEKIGWQVLPSWLHTLSGLSKKAQKTKDPEWSKLTELVEKSQGIKRPSESMLERSALYKKPTRRDAAM